MVKEFTNDSPEDVGKGSFKNDGGKAPVFRGALSYFPRAISAVAELSLVGSRTHRWDGWRDLPDGYNRYSDALVRHLIREGSGEVLDPGSGLLHATHACWNSLARLELLLKEREV